MSAISSAYLPGTSRIRSLNPHLSAAMKLTTTSRDAGVLGNGVEELGPYATLMDDPRSPSNERWVKQYLGDHSMTMLTAPRRCG